MNAATAQLRHARLQDAAAIVDILMSARRAFMPYAPLAHTSDAMLYWVQTHLIPSGGVTVAQEDDVLVGVLATSFADGISWIDQLYMVPTRVGRGLGTTLLSHAHAQLARPIRLYTFQANAGARRFYERHGYRVVALTDGQSNEEKCPDVLYELV